MTGTDYADDLALPANTPVLVESLRCSLEQASEALASTVCFKQQKRATSSGKPLKLVGLCSYLGSNISS